MAVSLDITYGSDDETRNAIREELSAIGGAAGRLTDMVRIERIVVPDNFAETVAPLRVGKRPFPPNSEPLVLPLPGRTGWVLVLHPRMFGPGFDAHIRHALYWHELTRLVHKMHFPAMLRRRPDREMVLLSELYRAFGEYDAARKAWAWRDSLLNDALKEPLSPLAREDFRRSLMGQVDVALATHHADYAANLNVVLRETGDVNSFLTAMRGFMVHRTVALALAWAAMDHAPDMGLEAAEKLFKGLPVAARPLLGFFRNRHVSGSPDLREGVPLLDALWQAWGLHLTDSPEGLAAKPVNLTA